MARDGDGVTATPAICGLGRLRTLPFFRKEPKSLYAAPKLVGEIGGTPTTTSWFLGRQRQFILSYFFFRQKVTRNTTGIGAPGSRKRLSSSPFRNRLPPSDYAMAADAAGKAPST